MDYVLNKLDELRERVETGEASREEINRRLGELERSIDDYLRPYVEEFRARLNLLEEHVSVRIDYDEVEEEFTLREDR